MNHVRQKIVSISLVAAFAAALSSCGGGNAATVVAGQAPSSAVGQPSTTPPGATVLDHIEDRLDWQTCGTCGNQSGNSNLPVLQKMEVTSPSKDGFAASFSIADTQPFTNGYWWVQQNATARPFSMLRYEFDLFIPPGDEALPQAIEFECQQQLNGYIYNFAWQADYGRGQWRIFDYNAQQWLSVSLPLAAFTPGVWHHIEAQFHNDAAAHTATHDTLLIDGIKYTVNLQLPAHYSGGSNNQFTNAIQLDTNSSGKGYGIVVDDMQLTYQQ